MVVVFGVLLIYYGILAIDPYRLVVIRDRKGKELVVDFAFTFYKAKELDDSLYYERYTICILLVYDIERYSAILYLIGKEREVYKVYSITIIRISPYRAIYIKYKDRLKGKI